MPWLAKLAGWLQQVLLPWGVWGLAAAAFFDSSYLSLAGGVDVWLVSLCLYNPARAPLYVAVAALGSVAGASALYFTVRRVGEAFSKKRLASERMAQVRRRVERYGSRALFVASITPPPTPFKLFIIAAGLLRHPFQRFVLALLVGRFLRYGVVGFLVVRYGPQAWELLLRSGPWAAAAVLLVVVLVILVLRLRRNSLPRSAS